MVIDFINHVESIYGFLSGFLLGVLLLLGGWALPLWKMMDFVSWDDGIPNICKNKTHVPNHQPVLDCIGMYCVLLLVGCAVF